MFKEINNFLISVFGLGRTTNNLIVQWVIIPKDMALEMCASV